LYRSGFTLYFHDLRTPAFEPLSSAINERLGLCGGRTRVSAFASSRGLGVATHNDVNDVDLAISEDAFQSFSRKNLTGKEVE
jgi:hypothetical protein